MIRFVSRLLAVALSLCLVTPVLAQVQPGQSPLSGARGGTNNAFMQFAGPSSTIKTFTLPNQSGTIATLGAIQTFSNKIIDTASNTFKLNGAAFGTATQATAALNAMVGDSGSGGTKGLVPAPGPGDAAAGKYLKADGTFAVPPGTGGGGGGAVTFARSFMLPL
jgi:hypothetical protein